MLQLAHPVVAQPKLEALRPQVCHCSFAEPERAPESLVKRTLFFLGVFLPQKQGIKGTIRHSTGPRK